MRTHMKMGRLGVWAQVDCMTASAEAEFARDVEQWGYSALWTPEAMSRDVLVNSGWLLANTRKLVIASGIANIFARDAMAMAAARVQLVSPPEQLREQLAARGLRRRRFRRQWVESTRRHAGR